jgi:predicted nucleic-acid-binding protein
VRALLVKVTEHAYKVTDEDLAAVKAHLAEDEIFELVIAAAMGKASRQLAAAQAAIADAALAEAP